MVNKKKIIQEANSLIEMYKAGFLDGYSKNKKPRSKKAFVELNKLYEKSFNKRFMKHITSKLDKK